MPSRVTESLHAWLDPFLEGSAHGTMLPTQGELAARFNLSERTVARALQGLARDGRVVRIQGKGTFVRKDDSPLFASTPHSSQPAWQTVAESLERDIHTGTIAEGTVLPSVKAASAQFGVSTHTMGRAYGYLVSAGALSRTGRTHRVVTHHGQVHAERRREVHVFVRDDFAKSTPQTGSRSLDLAYHLMESILNRSGYFVRYDFTGNLRQRLAQWERDVRVPYGLVFLNATDEVLADVHAVFRASPIRTRLRRIPMVFDLERVTRYGGRFFPQVRPLERPFGAWAKARALRDFVRSAGYSQVLCYMPGDTGFSNGKMFDYLMVFAECRKAELPVDFRFVFTREQHADLLEQLSYPSLPRILRFLLNFYEETPWSVFEERTMVVKETREVIDRTGRGAIHVFAHDADTAEAVQYARSRAMEVPGRFSAMSMESDPRFYHLGITRCELDSELLGFQLAHTLMEDLDSSALDGRRLVYQARVVEKLTTVHRRSVNVRDGLHPDPRYGGVPRPAPSAHRAGADDLHAATGT